VRKPISNSRHVVTTARTASMPLICPSIRLRDFCLAHRPFPSMMMAMCLGSLSLINPSITPTSPRYPKEGNVGKIEFGKPRPKPLLNFRFSTKIPIFQGNVGWSFLLFWGRRSERGKTCEVRGETVEEEGEMSKLKFRSPNGEISVRAEKRVLSANGRKICSGAVAHIPGANIIQYCCYTDNKS